MTSIPAEGYFTVEARTNAEAKTAHDDGLEIHREHLGGNAIAELTISSGSVTATQGFHSIDTEIDAGSDFLDNIVQTNLDAGHLLLIRAQDSGRTVNVRDIQGGAGEILTADGATFALDNIDKWLLLVREGAQWLEVLRSYGTDSASAAAFLGAAVLGANIFTGVQKWDKGGDVASTASMSLGTDGNSFDITGTDAITSIATLGLGTWVLLRFTGILTFTHHSTDLICPGGQNITTAVDTRILLWEYAVGDWMVMGKCQYSSKSEQIFLRGSKNGIRVVM